MSVSEKRRSRACEMTTSWRRHLAQVFIVVGVCLSLITPVAADERLTLTPTAFRIGSHLIQGDRGKLLVPENRNRADSGMIEIAFIRFRQSESSSEAPIVYLPGGPGQPVLEHAGDFAATYKNYLNLGGRGDMLIVEQRGIGQSEPRLDCPGFLSRPADVPLSADVMGSTHVRYIEMCRDHWTSQGVDLEGYDVVSMADDIDELRASLGYEKIKIYGESFGAHHALALIANHGERIESAALSAVIGPDDLFEMPAEVDRQLAHVERQAMRDRRWDEQASMASVLTRLKDSVDIRVSTEQGDQTLMIGRYDLALVTVTLARQTAFLDQLPILYETIATGDLRWLARWSAKLRQGHPSNLASLLITCASGASKERRTAIAKQAAESLVGDAVDLLSADVCTPVDDLAKDGRFQIPNIVDTPILMISAGLDMRAPFSNAEAILPLLKNGHHVIIPGVSHDFGDAREAQLDLAYRFLANGETELNPRLMPATP